jgi:4-carboxymuconolactone decarboxylase
MTDALPRLPVRRADDDPALAELFAKGLTGPDGEVLNIFGTLANHPDLLRRWLVFGSHVLSKSSLDERDRELLILRTGWNCRSRYEWGQHVLIARRSDITDDEIERVKAGPGAFEWSDHDRALLRAADDLHDRSEISDGTWAALSTTYDAAQLLDVVATVGNYHLVAMFLNTARVQLDPGVPDEDVPGRHLTG